jgi:hypothetical protein
MSNADLRALLLPGSPESVETALNFIKGALNPANKWAAVVDSACDWWLTAAQPASSADVASALTRVHAAHTVMMNPGFGSEDEQYGAVAYELDHFGVSGGEAPPPPSQEVSDEISGDYGK